MKFLNKIDSAEQLMQDKDHRLVSDVEKTKWNTVESKETPSGAQAKATKALTDAKTYVDGKVKTDVPAGAKFTDTVYTHPSTHETTMLREPAFVRGGVTATTQTLFDVLRGDRTAFLPAEQIIIEHSTDAGLTWTDANVSDSTKRRLFTGQRPSIVIPLKNGVKSTDCMLRVTITAMQYNVPEGTPETEKYAFWNADFIRRAERYTVLDGSWIWLNSNSDSIYLTVENATGIASTNWRKAGEGNLTGWSGGNYVRLNGGTFGGDRSQTSNVWNWRFTFRTCASNGTFDDTLLSTTYQKSQQSIFHIKTHGKNIWTIPNNYTNHEHMYKWDEYKNVEFPSDVTATNFIGNASTVNNKTVEANVPLNAKFTDTITTINNKTGAITKADIVALGIPSQDTVVDISGKADKTYVDNKVKTDVPENAVFTDTIVDISGKLSKSNDMLEAYTEKTQATTGIINLSLANVFTDTPSASRTYSITNAKSGVAHSFTLIITMGATIQTLTFPASVKWQGGEIPDMTESSKIYILTFMTIDGGLTWLGMSGGKFENTYQATDADFSGTTNGDFRYIGTETELAIPHVIKGVPVTSYKELFNSDQGKLVTKVVSTNSNVTSMSSMFRSSQATSLDLSSFDTSSVTSMDSMFYDSKATSLDLSSFDTSKVTYMSYMFRDSQATSIDLSSFDTSSVTSMSGMFYNSQATSLDLSSFDTSNVTRISYMFRDSQATSLDLSSFDTSSLTDMNNMFYNSQATSLDLSSFDTSKVTDMSSMFRGSKATSLDLSSFDTSSVTNMVFMFFASKATTGYARTQADADKFNASGNKPAALTFILKQ